jgi:uncharacterized protein YhjY with autotransporter beta-barrel domain
MKTLHTRRAGLRGLVSLRMEEMPINLKHRMSRKKTRHEPFSAIVAAGLVLTGICFAFPNEADAQILGTAESYGVLASSAVTNTGSSVIGGNLGLSPNGLASITGFPPGIVLGTTNAANAASLLARNDLTTAINTLSALPFTVDLTGHDLGGLVLTPAVYSFSSSAQLTGLLTLNGLGNPASQFVFQIGSTLTTASNSRVLLINGANGNNVYWVVGSSATLGTGTVFAGNILAATSITLNTGASLSCGRALARDGAVTLDTNVITLCTGGGSGGDTTTDQLFGLGTAGAQQAAFGASRLFGSTMMAQAMFGLFGNGPDLTGITPQTYRPMKLGAVESEEERIVNEGYHPRTWRLWTTGFGGTGSLDGNPGAGVEDLRTRTAGVGVGLDYQIDHSTLVGIAGGYSHSSFSVDQLGTNGTVEGGHVGLYGVTRYGQLYVAGIAEYTHFSNEADRSLDFVIQENAQGNFSSNAFGARTEAGWRNNIGPHNVTPFVGLDVISLRTDGFVEQSNDVLGLTFQADRATSLTSSLGVQFDTRLPLSNGQTLTPFARAAWVHEFYPDRGVDSFLTLSPAAFFAGNGVFAAEDVAKVDTGFTLDVTEHTGLFAYFDGELAGNSQSYAGSGGVKIMW